MYNTIIIGSGISGLFVLKEMKDKNINDVIVIDKNKNPFGVWNIQNHPSVMDNTYSVSSKLLKEICFLSHIHILPPPKFQILHTSPPRLSSNFIMIRCASL